MIGRVPIELSGSLQNPAWSPGGDWLSFTRWREGYNNGRADIFTYELATQHLIRVPLSADSEANVSQPGNCWSDKGIIFSTDMWGADSAAYWNEGKITRLFDAPPDQTWEPSWGNDFYVAERHRRGHGRGQIIRQSLAGGPVVALTNELRDCRQPCVSHDATEVVFQEDVGKFWRIVLMELDSRMESHLGTGTDITFSYDGAYLVFSDDNGKLQVMEIATRDCKPVDVRTTYSGAPSLSPDGKFVAYEGGVSGDDGGAPTSIYITNAPEWT